MHRDTIFYIKGVSTISKLYPAQKICLYREKKTEQERKKEIKEDKEMYILKRDKDREIKEGKVKK